MTEEEIKDFTIPAHVPFKEGFTGFKVTVVDNTGIEFVNTKIQIRLNEKEDAEKQLQHCKNCLWSWINFNQTLNKKKMENCEIKFKRDGRLDERCG